MLTLNLHLPKEVENELEKDLKWLEKTTKQPREYHIKEALIRYIEDMEDIRDVEKYVEAKKKGQVKYYTSEEVKERLERLKKSEK